jgi:hypothetical protein
MMDLNSRSVTISEEGLRIASTEGGAQRGVKT